jgi:hypothetical protein
MSYLFQSRACADVFMLQSTGDALLQALGREPAAQGIIEPESIPELLARLKQAIDADNTANPQQAASYPESTTHTNKPNDDLDADVHDALATVSLRQRWWPFQDMLQRSYQAQKAIVWGVASA